MSVNQRPGRGIGRQVISLIDPFIVALLVVIGLASVLPVRGGAGTVVEHMTTGAVCLLFFLHGAKLSPTDAVASFARWRFQLLVLGMTFLIFPVFGLAVGLLPDGVLSPQLAAGVLFLCVLPSTVQSSIAFTSIARGNVALAVSSASVSNLLGVILTPVLAALLIGSQVTITTGSVLGIVGELAVPFVLGQLLHRKIGGWLGQHRLITAAVDRGSILLVVYSAMSISVAGGLWQMVPPASLAMVTVVSVVLLAIILLTSWGIGRVSGIAVEDRIVLLLCGSKKSLASGLPMATLLFATSSVGIMVLPLMIFHLIQLIVCAVLARIWSLRPLDAPATRPAEVTSAAAV